MNKKIFLTLVILTCFTGTVFASEKNDEIIKTFQKLLTIPQIQIVVPTTIEVPIPNQIYSSYFAVYNQTQDRFEPYITISKTSRSETVPQTISTSPSQNNTASLFDGNFQTNTQFDVDQNGVGYVEITYVFDESIKSNSLYISLEQYVSLPNSITIKTIENGQERIIASKIKPSSNVINFAETSAKNWKIEISYSQPLRINELQIKDLNYKESPRAFRFLAQPNTEYKIYAEPDLIMNQQTGERPNLYSNDGLKIIQSQEVVSNQSYVLADTDGDGVPDIRDNCVYVYNSDQEDVDGNGRGDVCDDWDKDGIINSLDNCINEPNTDQKDTDLDGIGDVCDDEESRITEKYPWIVWGGIIFAGLLFLGLFSVAVIRIRKNKALQSNGENFDNNIPRV